MAKSIKVNAKQGARKTGAKAIAVEMKKKTGGARDAQTRSTGKLPHRPDVLIKYLPNGEAEIWVRNPSTGRYEFRGRVPRSEAHNVAKASLVFFNVTAITGNK
jgi:hypothetical protein